MRGSKNRAVVGVVCLGGLVGLALGSCGGQARSVRSARDVTTPVQLPECGGTLVATNGSTLAVHRSEDPGLRQAAQRGLRFLGEDTVAWQEQHQCYGCHVQAVTLDAFIVGRNNHYEVPDEHFDEVLRGLLDINGGARGPNGFSVGGDAAHLIESSKSFGGAAIAEYDEHVSSDLEDILIQASEGLLAFQNDDGSVRSTDRRPPVVAGEMQSTTQAARTWRQAYARTADDRWLDPIGRAEQYIRARAANLTDAESTYLQDLNYAIVGLLAAGAGPGEAVVELLAAELRERQSPDGGWAFDAGGASDAFATGQSLYVLKRLGTSDRDQRVVRGIGWLVEHQQDNGGWSSGGDRRGEAMWGVLGLVSIDVLSVDIAGLDDGAHLRSAIRLRAEAVDANGAPARSVEVRVDDVAIGRACAGEFSATVDPSSLETGAHRVDVIATSAEGKVSRRRLTFYSGDYYLTRVGSRYQDGHTAFSLRNVATTNPESRVRLRIFEAGAGGARGERIYDEAVDAAPGAMTLDWNGENASGTAVTSGRYVAEIAYLDGGGAVRQSVNLPFVHDTAAAQAEQFGQVAGRIAFEDADMEGAAVELVDQEGNVVQSTSSTRNGQYRFRNVDRGNYRVRVRRQGLGVREAPVSAAPAASTAADLSF
ncbi:MAG: carboxypeptidase regulatory-like domain-containing protein [Deltaproteobacteria bacterium]|nr:carboxypeptidase regulatory-like domain-containing protein [Deltaproteobacteria bacterium]